jgi:hypothetical protein
MTEEYDPRPLPAAPGWSIRKCRHTGVQLAQLDTTANPGWCELNLSWSAETLHIRIKNPICNLQLAIPMTVLRELQNQ